MQLMSQDILGYFGDILGIFLGYFWNIFGIFLGYFGDIFGIFWKYSREREKRRLFANKIVELQQ